MHPAPPSSMDRSLTSTGLLNFERAYSSGAHNLACAALIGLLSRRALYQRAGNGFSRVTRRRATTT